MPGDAPSCTPRRPDVSTPAVVLKFDPNVLHHGGLGVIRSLGRMGVPVYGVHESRTAPAASSGYLRGRCFWQPDPADPAAVVAGLRALAGRIGQRAVLLPTDDAGAIFLAEHGGPLRGDYLFAAPPAGLPRQLAGKFSLYELCRELDIPAPQTVLPGSLAQAREFAVTAGFPLIAKLTTPWTGRGLRSTSILTSPAELVSAYHACADAGAGLMLQELIPGGSGHDWFFHGYCDARAACRPAFTGIKERSYPAHAGLTSLGRSVPNPELSGQVTSLLSRLHYSGILDLDLRLDPRDGRYRLLDFNPRLGAQFRLFRDSAGVDVATAAYLDLTGQPIPAGEQPDGRGFWVENYDPLGALGYWRAGELSPRSWLASLRTVDEAAWFARDDLRPFGLMCLRMGWRLVSRPVTSRARRAPRTDFRYRPGRAQAGAGSGGTAVPGALPCAVSSRPAGPEHVKEDTPA
ncbi:MAG: ATP-grasp domain-containing protein [Streptosporangiaceae bacterium]